MAIRILYSVRIFQNLREASHYLETTRNREIQPNYWQINNEENPLTNLHFCSRNIAPCLSHSPTNILSLHENVVSCFREDSMRQSTSRWPRSTASTCSSPTTPKSRATCARSSSKLKVAAKSTNLRQDYLRIWDSSMEFCPLPSILDID